MKRNSLKRLRSEEDENDHAGQIKIWVNQKICDLNDVEKMKQIHEKTTRMLKAAAAAGGNYIRPTGHGRNEIAEPLTSGMSDHYHIEGNGVLQTRDLGMDDYDDLLARRKCRSCNRMTLLHDICVNCSTDLCEECGYSCQECSKFICRSCVTLFGNKMNEAEQPFCERCQIFVG